MQNLELEGGAQISYAITVDLILDHGRSGQADTRAEDRRFRYNEVQIYTWICVILFASFYHQPLGCLYARSGLRGTVQQKLRGVQNGINRKVLL